MGMVSLFKKSQSKRRLTQDEYLLNHWKKYFTNVIVIEIRAFEDKECVD